jgi:membrane protein required for colicin V production
MMLTTLDWILVVLLLLSAVLGLWRGLIEEVMSLGGWFISGLAGLYLADSLSPHLAMTGLSDTLRYGLAFVLIFITTLIVWSMLTAVIKKAIGAVGLGALDRLLGAAFGLLRGALILIVLTVLISYSPIQATDFWQTSNGVRLGLSAAQSLKPYAPAVLAGLIP